VAQRPRLDQLIVDRGLAPSRHQAQALIRTGKILVDDRPMDKPGTRVRPEVAIRVRGQQRRFVSRGGDKLEAGLEAFDLSADGRVCADLGASTGGFTDCLLQRGAARVYAVDVGYGQLAWKLRQDPRVVVMERTNARHLESLPEPPSLVVADLSFISMTKVLPAMQRLSAPGAEAVVLVKPQFEAGRERVGRGGVVRDRNVRAEVIEEVRARCLAQGAKVLATLPSPVPGAKKGNVEELFHLLLTDDSAS